MAPQREYRRQRSVVQSRRHRHCCSPCLMTWPWVTLLQGWRRCYRTSRQSQLLFRRIRYRLCTYSFLRHRVAADAAAEADDHHLDRWFTNKVNNRYWFLAQLAELIVFNWLESVCLYVCMYVNQGSPHHTATCRDFNPEYGSGNAPQSTDIRSRIFLVKYYLHQWRRQDLLRGGAKMEIMVMGHSQRTW